MSETMSTSPAPLLSPGFDKAKRLSRILAVLFAVGFWVTLLFVVCVSLIAMWPEGFEQLKSAIKSVAPRPVDFPVAKRWAATGIVCAAMIPILGVFESARRVFGRFADGDVFSLKTIDGMRTTAIWLIIAGIVPPRPLLLIVGIAAFVAAYVMAEATRLADDSASIV